jgi:hypothetical protein
MLTLVRVRSSIGALAMLSMGAPAVAAQSRQANPRTLDSIAGAGVLQNRAVGLVAAVVKGNDTLLMKA